jgi:hypothetical protein
VTIHEQLLQEATHDGINVIDYDIPVSALKGFYCNNTIVLDKSLDTTAEKACVLAEELGHHHLTAGCILDEGSVANVKQERLARNWAYEKMVSTSSIIEAYKMRLSSREDFADHLGVTEEFLEQAIRHYEVKHDNSIELDGYVIVFSPLGVMKRM